MKILGDVDKTSTLQKDNIGQIKTTFWFNELLEMNISLCFGFIRFTWVTCNCILLLTHFGLYEPLTVKISTLPPLCFMFYYKKNSYAIEKKSKFQKKLYPPFGRGP